MSPESFESFLKINKNRIYGYLLRFVEIDDDAQDLMQELCIAFYHKIEQIESETALSYMYRMAHNMALNWRKRNAKTFLRPNDDFDRMKSIDEVTERPFVVNKAIAKLPPKLATIVHMYYYDKMSYKEISLQTGRSIKAVDSMLNRARIKLRRLIRLNDDGSFELTQ